MSPDSCGRCGKPAGPSPARCTRCGTALCVSCAAQRDQAGRGPECTGIPLERREEDVVRQIQTGEIRTSDRRPPGK